MHRQGFTGNVPPTSQRDNRERVGREEHSTGGDEELTLSYKDPSGSISFDWVIE